MIKYVVLIISFTLVSCSTLPPVAYLDVIESSYRAIAGYPDKKITESFYKEQKYSFAKARVGNSEDVILVLSKIEGEIYKWVSADNSSIFTLQGRIIGIDGFARSFRVRNPRKGNEFFKSKDRFYYETMDFFSPELYGSTARSHVYEKRISEFSYLSQDIDIEIIHEELYLENIGWRVKNKYYYSEELGVLRSEQKVHPLFPEIKIEFYLK